VDKGLAHTASTVCGCRRWNIRKGPCKTGCTLRNSFRPLNVPTVHKWHWRWHQVEITLFADDSLLYLGIDYIDDCNQLQKHLDKLVNWASEWQMKFNASKCYILRITNKKKPVIHNYTMHDQILENVDQNSYLGVQFTNMLQQHIS
jgi:hypothetical protein